MLLIIISLLLENVMTALLKQLNRTDILCFLLTNNNDNKLLKYLLFQPKQLFLFDKEVTEKYGRVCG